MKRTTAFVLAVLLVVAAMPAFATSDVDELLLKLYIDSFVVSPGDLTYQKLDFKELSRYPEKHEEEPYKFTGRVVQVLGSREDGYEMRIATDGKYDNVVYVMLGVDPEFGILEDDTLTIYAKYYGMYSYSTVLGGKNTLPLFVAHLVELNE